MDFSLTTEQQMLSDSVARFARGGREANWATMAALGWTGIAIPEASGGLGSSAVEVMIIMEGLGRGLVAQPFAESCVLCPTLLTELGQGHRPELQGLASGAHRAAFAGAEAETRFDPLNPRLRARRRPDGWVLDGVKSFVPDAAGADHFLVTARTGSEGPSVFLVPRDAPGLEREDFLCFDGHPASRLRFTGTALQADALLGAEGGAGATIELALDRATAALCAEALGAMEALREATAEHLRTRQQFGQPLAGFQVLQHRLVEMFLACEEARSMTLLATLRLEAERRDRIRAVSAAKARIAQLARSVAHQAIQLHGAMGMCEEFAVGRQAKRLIAIGMLYGDADHHRRRFACA